MEVQGVAQLQPQEAQAALENGAVMVDVREAYERNQAHIPGSLFAPLSEFMNHVEALPKDKLLVMQCAAGARSQQAAAYLAQEGYKVANLMHGISGWARMGLPIAGPEDS